MFLSLNTDILWHDAFVIPFFFNNLQTKGTTRLSHLHKWPLYWNQVLWNLCVCVAYGQAFCIKCSHCLLIGGLGVTSSSQRVADGWGGLVDGSGGSRVVGGYVQGEWSQYVQQREGWITYKLKHLGVGMKKRAICYSKLGIGHSPSTSCCHEKQKTFFLVLKVCVRAKWGRGINSGRPYETHS